eukprot:TRINITY_DN124_c0_g1_i1.p1 TRINITY_DN124_c0_g1~~TRINITY_DN124_c0_g1_i1.p1  ORF type:complete len:507 (-),score=104.11 TRINITY_DN124_c0_g1_i1:30-1526(-)
MAAPATTASGRLPVESWVIPFEELQLTENIGCGGFGEVYHANWAGTDVAVKKVWCSQREQQELIESFKVEIAVLTALRHPNIVLFLGASMEFPNLCMVMEYVRGGNLRKLLNDDAIPLSIPLRVRMAADTARALLYLHKKSIIHRDLKTYNLLVDDEMRIKVCDFGLARVKLVGRVMSMRGTTDWMAPEVAQGVAYDEKADVFSFGVILAELITRLFPDDFPRRGIMNLEYEGEKLRVMFPSDTPKVLADLCVACVQTQPASRPSMAQIVDKLTALEKELGPPAPRVAAAPPAAKPNYGTLSLTNSLTSKLQLGDQEANMFWAASFGSQFQASFDSFAQQAAAFTQESQENINLMKPMLVDAATGCVTQRTLSVYLLYFKPFSKSFKQAVALLKQPWFHGAIDEVKAAQLLKDQPVGVFLVRFNDAPQGTYAISFVKEAGREPSNALVSNDSKGYCTGDPSVPTARFYPTLDDLIFHHKARLVSPLTVRRGGSKYDSL